MTDSYPPVLSKSKHEQKMQEIKQKYINNRRKASASAIHQQLPLQNLQEINKNTGLSPNTYISKQKYSPSPLKNKQMNVLPSQYNQYKSMKHYESQKCQFTSKQLQTLRNYNKQIYYENPKSKISPNKKIQDIQTNLSTKEYETHSKLKERCNYDAKVKSPIKKYDQNHNREYEQSKMKRRKQLQVVHMQRTNSIKIQKEKNHKSINQIQSILSKIKQHLRHPTS